MIVLLIGLFLLRTSSFDTFNVHAREYVVGELSQILDPNICYKVSFKYSLAETSQLAISNLGIYFSNSIPVSNASIYSSNYINYQPQVEVNQIMNDTENWVEIERFYTATGNENYFTIGNFNDNNNTQAYFVKNGFNSIGGKTSYIYLDDIHIEEVPPLTLNQIYLGNDTTLCKGDSLMLNPSLPPNTVRVWNNLSNDSTYIIKESGTYWLEAYNGCSYITDTIEVTFADLEFSLGNDTTLCENESLNLELNKPNVKYLWSDGGVTNSNTIDSSGTYWLQISKDGCIKSDTINIDYNIFEVNLGADTFLCNNEEYLLELNIPNATYQWHDNSNNNAYLVKEGEYITVKATVENCSISDQIMVQYFDSIPNIKLNDTLLCGLNEYTIDINTNRFYDKYLWNTGDDSSTITIYESDKYEVEIFNKCYSKQFSANISFEGLEEGLNNYNIFSPNGDFLNDLFTIYEGNSEEYIIQIYNRWGKLVWQSDEPTNHWSAEGVSDGIYYYHLSFRNCASETIEKKGTVEVIR